MFDTEPLISNSAFDHAPLSRAFNRAWSDWLVFWQALPRTTSAEVQVAQVAEQVSLIARRLWRSAFTAVGDVKGQQAKATLYAFVGLVDEHLLFDDWAGQHQWQQQPMENRLFGTRSAGDRIPAAIKRLLDARDPASRDLADVYLLCLVLGFEGRLRSGNGKALHEKWRRGLFWFSRERPASLSEIKQQLEGTSAIAPQQLAVRRSLPDGYRLGLAIAIGFLILLAVSQVFWVNIQSQVTDSLNQTTNSPTVEQKR